MLLRRPTSPGWTAAALGDLDAFLLDHAGCERKASASALAMVSHYPDRAELVDALIGLAREELDHFHRVYGWIARRGLRLAPDTRNPYMGRLAAEFREGSDGYFLDRLLAAGIAEARGCERFALLGAALPSGELADFYRELARAEVRHQELYLELARRYFPTTDVDRRLDELLDAEAKIVAELPVRAALY
jgi:tRNA-(ms[2]io[6]A)-hydroxylase